MQSTAPAVYKAPSAEAKNYRTLWAGQDVFLRRFFVFQSAICNLQSAIRRRTHVGRITNPRNLSPQPLHFEGGGFGNQPVKDQQHAAVGQADRVANGQSLATDRGHLPPV